MDTLRVDRIKLRELRRARRLTGIDFAKLVGVGNNYISQIENGMREPSHRLREKMAQVLEVGIDDLLVSPARQQQPDPREQFLREAFRALPDEMQTELLAFASKLVGRARNGTD